MQFKKYTCEKDGFKWLMLSKEQAKKIWQEPKLAEHFPELAWVWYADETESVLDMQEKFDEAYDSYTQNKNNGFFAVPYTDIEKVKPFIS